jgi:hypothetical protein
MGKFKNRGSSGGGLIRKRFKCGHSAYTDKDRKDCPKCEGVRS